MIYPDMDSYMDSDSNRVHEVPRLSNLQKNCNQIFIKGPAVTKDFLEKINADMVPKKSYLLGYEIKTKQMLFTAGLFLLLFSSSLGAIVMWFTDIFDNAVLASIALSNSSENFDMWKKPSPKPLVKVHLFNYTNIYEYEAKFDKKLHVEEIGPYVYEEALERVNVEFDDDTNTVSYQEKRSYKFRPDLSKGKQSDQVTFPNIPLLTGAAMYRHKNYFSRLGYASLLTGLGEKPFITLAADSLILGYDDHLYDISKSISAFNNKKTPEKFGLFSSKIGLQSQVITMNTGKSDINKLGIIEKYDNKEKFDYFSTDECNRVQSSDGAMYPPLLVQKKQPLYYLFPQMCRAMPVFFQNEDTIFDGKIPAYKYAVPDDIYNSIDETPENQCFCSLTSGNCAMKGVFNATPCSEGAPLYFSNPHFYNGDDALFNGVTGLSKNERDYTTWLKVHPTIGFIMAGSTKFQLNIEVQKPFGVYQLDMFEEGLMLPLTWFEVELNENELPEDFVHMIHKATFTLKGIKLAFKYGCLLTSIITLICIVLVLKSSRQLTKKIEPSGSRRILQRHQEVEI